MMVVIQSRNVLDICFVAKAEFRVRVVVNVPVILSKIWIRIFLANCKPDPLTSQLNWLASSFESKFTNAWCMAL